jgi:drug/metabolite transporter (DMT)-like permease
MNLYPLVNAADRPLRGILYMLAGIAFFGATDGLSKWMVMALPVLQIVALRNACVLGLVIPAVIRAGGLKALATRRPWGHAARAVSSVVALTSFFEALRHLPLATCIAIGFCSPLFMTVASVVLLREHVGAHRWAAIAVGFAGVMVIAWPDAETMASWAAVLMVVSSLFFALSMTTVRWLARTESDVSMLFYQNAGMMLPGLIALPLVWQTPTDVDLLGIAAMAVTLAGGQILMIRAFRAAPVAVVAPFEYTELLWAALIGYIVWNEMPAPHVWTGAGIVVLSGLYMIWRETRAARPVFNPAPVPASSATGLPP